MAETDSEPHDVEKRASAIAHEFFWCVAGRHQACVEQLQKISAAVPDSVWWNLCFEPLVFGLSFFGEGVREWYAPLEQELFEAELETAVRWLLATTLFAPGDTRFPESQMPPSARTESLPAADGFYRKGTNEPSPHFHAGAKHDRDNFRDQQPTDGFGQALRGTKDRHGQEWFLLSRHCVACFREGCRI